MADIVVRPVVVIDGKYYDCDSDTIPLDGIQVRWGRSGLLEKPQAATADITLLDKTNTWRDWFQSQSLPDGVIGVKVFLQANLFEDGVFKKSWTWFRGTITNVSVESGPRDAKTNERVGYLIHIEATDPMAILGEVDPPVDGEWAQNETLLTRANYLRNDALPYAGISEMFFDPVKQPFWCSATSLDKSIGALLDEFYQSQATQPCYSPKDNCVRDGQQFNGTIKLGWYRYNDGYIHITPRENPRVGAYGNDTDRYYGTSVSGAMVSDSGGVIARTAEQGITAWDIEYYSRERGHDWARLTFWQGTELLPRKKWTLRTWLTNDVDVDYIFEEMADMLEGPLVKPTHPSVNFSTSNSQGFESVVQAMNLIMAGERQFLLFVSGTPWAEIVGQTPMFGVVGGVIRLENQQWDIDMQLQPYAYMAYQSYSDATWDRLPRSVDWGDVPECDDKLEHGISWYDTGFVHEPTVIRTWADDN